VTPRGFQFGAVAAGVAKPDRLDLGLICSETEAAVAGVFTRNRVVAAPVRVCRDLLGGGRAQAVLVNSGNANACTGEQGVAAARKLTARVADVLGVRSGVVFPCSTGVIGLPLPVDRMAAAIPELAGVLSPDPGPFAEAIMTTDSFPKTSSRTVSAGGCAINVLGVAKGAGMIRPDMATMLAFLATDAPVSVAALQSLLTRAVEITFNRTTVDGDTSTNDTVLALANGCAGGEVLDANHLSLLEEAVSEVCRDLARMIIRDGEGATKVVDVRVTGASTDADAVAIAYTIAESPLVKTATHAADPNWGRIAMALGRSGPYRGGSFGIAIGGVRVVAAGEGLGLDAEAAAREAMGADEYEILVELEEGPGTATVTTCDLSADYVRINAEYRT
jgi:glutamate N-acetyltransferase/amino-acid N-acetyltransferase